MTDHHQGLDRRVSFLMLSLLRSMALLSLMAYLALNPISPDAQRILLWQTAAFALFTGVSIVLYRVRSLSEQALMLQLIMDLLMMFGWLTLTGGATNAFVSLLLIPIAIAAVSLSVARTGLIALFAVVGYSLLLIGLPAQMELIHQQHSMQQHFVGMWFNFMLSALILLLVVRTIVAKTRRQDRQLARMREQQLRRENVLALGVAAAQASHQLATPVATLGLLYEELSARLPGDEDVAAMRQPLHHCQRSLDQIRQVAAQLNNVQRQSLTLAVLVDKLLDNARLLWPQAEVVIESTVPELTIESDPSLVPALLNIVQNAVEASVSNSNQRVELSFRADHQRISLIVRDFGCGIPEAKRSLLGRTVVDSDSGFGVGTLLSHTSLERLGAEVVVESCSQGTSVMIDFASKEQGQDVEAIINH